MSLAWWLWLTILTLFQGPNASTEAIELSRPPMAGWVVWVVTSKVVDGQGTLFLFLHDTKDPSDI